MWKEKVHWFIEEDDEYEKAKAKAQHPFFRLAKSKETPQEWIDQIAESRDKGETHRILCGVKTSLTEEDVIPSKDGVRKKGSIGTASVTSSKSTT